MELAERLNVTAGHPEGGMNMAGEPIDRVWELMEHFTIGMLVTVAGENVRARPMAATVKRDEEAVYFLTNADSVKAGDIAANSAVAVLFVDAGGQKYVSLRGDAEVRDDRAKIREIWTPFAKAWWDGPDDPEIRVVAVKPVSAEYWDSPGKIAAYAAMLASAVTGAKPAVGENETVAL
jgi:general stress protein 26